jgi:hypothetical protein
MNRNHSTLGIAAVLTVILGIVPACGGGGGDPSPAVAPVQLSLSGPNAVTHWNQVASNTINVPAAASGSAAERRPTDSVDLAVVHIAIYNALAAITGRYQPYADLTQAVSGDVSEQAAVAAAAYGVLKGMFPNRSAEYQAAYDSFLAAMPDDAAKAGGVAAGAAAAAAMLALRGDDGRSVVLAPYVAGITPGAFRGTNPVNRHGRSIKTFALTGASQFRAPPPPALESEAYARDFNETRLLGGAIGSTRTAAQLELARFHTEAPSAYWQRNLRRFAMNNGSLVDQARLLAMLFTVQADAGIACFDSKYHYESWRPQSAITLADTNLNPATAPDPAWSPVVPTPNHPEYPAAHGCITGAIAETLKTYYRTDQVEFTMDSTVTGTTHSFTTTQAMVDEVVNARVYGGMHFRNSTLRGAELGTSVARWALERNFQSR